ncbi:hypothetical protein [Hymenobacter antarcticus]|uniref:Uncharacterized protein n=1 Tax=Hymenobacter antarcticus TaxID=486270 RepID=A0ABP7QSU0_9BACT
MSDSPIRSTPDEEWDDLMRQLRDQPKARPRPFFYTRVQARLAASAAAKSQLLPGWLRRPAYAVLLGALVMALSGDGAALRPAAEANHCETCPSGQPLPPLQR